VITCKPGVQFTTIAPAGMRLLEAIRAASKTLNLPIVITSACDGTHSGPTDVHKTGEAFDLRTHNFAADQKLALLREIMLELQADDMDAPLDVSNGLATKRFFGFLEHPGAADEHIHVQRRNATVYTMADYLAA
jgi:hypothetical protein